MQSTAQRSPASKSSDSDRDLIRLALAGNQSGYEALTSRYQDRLYRSVLLEVQCSMLAEDIVQDAFVRAFLNLDSFRSDASFYTWLYRIALNVRHVYLRKLTRALPLEILEEGACQASAVSHESPPRSIERVEECGQVRAALRRLDEPHRTILILREFEGFDYQTIADLLKIKVGTVRSRLSRAREQLKHELTAYLQAGRLPGPPQPLSTSVTSFRTKFPR